MHKGNKMRSAPIALALALYLLLPCACNERSSPIESSDQRSSPVQAHTAPSPASAEPLGSLLVVQEGTANTPQLMSLAGGGFTVARRAGVTMGLELELKNIAEVPITYWGFHDATYPIFEVEQFVNSEWQEIPMGFCGSGTGLQMFSIEAGGEQRMLVPLPEGTSPIRVAVEVESSTDSEHTDRVSAEWRS